MAGLRLSRVELRRKDKGKSRRGFAGMDRALVSEIARKGGKAAHVAGTAHEFTKAEAAAAGRKGGEATHARRRAQEVAKDAVVVEKETIE